MVIYEGKAFDEKQVLTIETREDSTWSRNVKDRYYIKITFKNNSDLRWNRYYPETAVSKLNEIVALINAREEELLKLKAN